MNASSMNAETIAPFATFVILMVVIAIAALLYIKLKLRDKRRKDEDL